MSEIDSLLILIKEDINKEPCVQEYLRLKNVIENDSELKKLSEDIKFYQKEMCKNHHNSRLYQENKKIYDSLVQKYNSHPICINYELAKEELKNFLLEIKEVIEQ